MDEKMRWCTVCGKRAGYFTDNEWYEQAYMCDLCFWHEICLRDYRGDFPEDWQEETA